MSTKIKLVKIESGEIVEMTPEEIVKEVNNPDWHCDDYAVVED